MTSTTYTNEDPLLTEDIGGYLISMRCNSGVLIQHRAEGVVNSAEIQGVPDGICLATIQVYTKVHEVVFLEDPETELGLSDPAPPITVPVGDAFRKPSTVQGFFGMERP